MKKLFITLLAALTLFAAVPQMCFAEEPTTPPVPTPCDCVDVPGGDNN